VWDVPATTNAIAGLADELFEMGIERVVLESTSDYWRALFYLLEARGICVWLAKLNEEGMLRPSFVLPSEIRELCDYTRLRTDLVRELPAQAALAARSRGPPELASAGCVRRSRSFARRSPAASTSTTRSSWGFCSARSTLSAPRSTCLPGASRS